MSDKPKSIQEALAEVQRNVMENYPKPNYEKLPNGGFKKITPKKLTLDTSVGKEKIEPIKPEVPKPAATSPKTSVPTTPTKNISTGQAMKTLGGIAAAVPGVSGAMAVGGMAAGGLGYLATETKPGRELGQKIGGYIEKTKQIYSTPVHYDPDRPTMGNQVVPPPPTEKASSVFDRIRSGASPASTPATTGKTEAPKSTELPKIDVSADKKETSKPTSFSQAFKAAREKATEMGKPSTGQFDYEGKKYQTNIKGEKYVPMTQQTKVDTSKTETVPLPPPRPTDLNKPESESGGKKKKMSEETNPLIAAFMKLQTENPSNMFEAAKKMSPKEKSLASLGHPKDKITKKDVLIGRGVLPKDVEEAVGDETAKKETSMSVTVDNKPSTPAQTAAATSGPSASDKKALDSKFKSIAKEEVEEITFSQAEIDHINSFFLEASVAPNRPEVAIGADSTSDKMSQNDVTGTAESGGKKKVKEEVQIYESMPASVIASKKKYAEMSDEDFAKMHGQKSEKELRDMAARHGYGWDKASKTGSDHYVKRIAAGMKTNEEVEEIDEILSASPKRKIPDWIKRKRNFNGRHDLIKAGNLNYDGSKKKSKEEPKKDDVKEDTIPHKQNDVDPKFKSNTLTPPKAPVKQPKLKFDKKVLSKMYEETLEEGRPKKNPTPETLERDPRKHIQVEAGRAAAGNVIDFHHNDGSKSKITPAMGRRITSHLQGLKPADRQAAVNKMHDSAEGLKV